MSYENPRIKLTSSMLDVIQDLSEGNPGAITAVMEMMEANPRVDPQDAFGMLGPLLALDNMDCYGSNIYLLYSDVCKRSVVNVLVLLRAEQLGLLSAQRIWDAIRNEAPFTDQDIAWLTSQVQQQLLQFNRTEA